MIKIFNRGASYQILFRNEWNWEGIYYDTSRDTLMFLKKVSIRAIALAEYEELRKQELGEFVKNWGQRLVDFAS